MAKCIIYNLSPSYCYKKFKCRCDVCLGWKKEAAQRTNDKELAKERSRTWRENNLDRSRQNSKNYQATHPNKVLEWALKKYDLTVDEYEQMLLEQDGKCAICSGDIGGMQNSKTRLCVDHDNVTGEVRGLLCGSCNVGIGHLKHSINLLKHAIEYLQGEEDV